jgi:hypothetical protein
MPPGLPRFPASSSAGGRIWCAESQIFKITLLQAGLRNY